MVEELAKVFPEAKILLNVRDVDAWLRSIQKTLRRSFEEDQRWTSKPLKYARFYAPTCTQFPAIDIIYRYLDITLARPIMLCDESTAAVLCDYDYSDISKLKARFAAHYTNIYARVDERRLLEYNVQDGWIPLCAFLEVECPPDRRPFPRVNDAAELIESGQNSWLESWKNSVINVTISLAIVAGLGWIVLA